MKNRILTADNALGGAWANILRLIAMLLVVAATIMHKRGYFEKINLLKLLK